MNRFEKFVSDYGHEIIRYTIFVGVLAYLAYRLSHMETSTINIDGDEFKVFGKDSDKYVADILEKLPDNVIEFKRTKH